MFCVNCISSISHVWFSFGFYALAISSLSGLMIAWATELMSGSTELLLYGFTEPYLREAMSGI